MKDVRLIRDLMTVGVETCSPETPILDLARLILEKEEEDVVVLEEGNAIGVVGQEELIRAYARGDFHTLKARDIMREGVLQVPPDIPLSAAAQVMLDHGARSIFLMHHAGGIEYPAAVITYRHLLRHMTAGSNDELGDLGIHADRQSPLESFMRRRDAARRKNTGEP